MADDIYALYITNKFEINQAFVDSFYNGMQQVLHGNFMKM